MKKKYRIITILLTVAAMIIATRILVSISSDLDRIKEKSGQVSGRAIRERLRPLETKHNKLSQEKKAQLSRMIRQNKPGPKKLEQLKKEYKKLPAHERKFLNYIVKAYPTP